MPQGLFCVWSNGPLKHPNEDKDIAYTLNRQELTSIAPKSLDK